MSITPVASWAIETWFAVLIVLVTVAVIAAMVVKGIHHLAWWILHRMDRAKPVPKLAQDTVIDRVQESLRWARGAWAIPEGYFRNWQRENFRVYRTGAIGECCSSSPLHALMNACHSHVPQEDRDALWASEAYREAVAHALSHTSYDEAMVWAQNRLSDGYWEPMARTVAKAALLGLCSCERKSMGYALPAWTPEADAATNEVVEAAYRVTKREWRELVASAS